MATKVKFTCLPRKTINICSEMIEDVRFHHHPKLFHLWVALHEYKYTTHGALAKKLGCTKDVIKKHIRKMKELKLIESTGKNEYTVPVSTWGAFIDRKLEAMDNYERTDDQMIKMAQMIWEDNDQVRDEWQEGKIFFEEQLTKHPTEPLATISF